MVPLLLSVGNKFRAEEKCCCQEALQNLPWTNATKIIILTQVLLQAASHVLFKVVSNVAVPLTGMSEASCAPASYHLSCHCCTFFRQSGISSWHCGSMCLLFVVKRGEPTAEGQASPPHQKPPSEGLVNQSQMKGESSLWGSCQGRRFLAEGDNSWLK